MAAIGRQLYVQKRNKSKKHKEQKNALSRQLLVLRTCLQCSQNLISGKGKPPALSSLYE